MLLKGRALGFERAPHDDATLVAALQRCAVTQVPARFYLGLQLAIPAAIELWSLGWRRGAIAMLGVGAFGVWALFKQAIEQASAADMGNPAPSVWLRAATRV